MCGAEEDTRGAGASPSCEAASQARGIHAESGTDSRRPVRRESEASASGCLCTYHGREPLLVVPTINLEQWILEQLFEGALLFRLLFSQVFNQAIVYFRFGGKSRNVLSFLWLACANRRHSELKATQSDKVHESAVS